MINIVGVGRSGTNLLGNILDSHTKIFCDLEVQPQFNLSVSYAIYRNPTYLKKLISIYKAKENKYSIYTTKDHANLWFTEELSKELDITYLGIYRNIYQVVASSLNHSGVMKWFEGDNIFTGYPYPKNNMSLIEKVTWRIIKHYERMGKVKNIYLLDFTQLCRNPKRELEGLQKHLNLKEEFDTPYIKPNVLSKWEKDLRKEDIRLIDETCQLASHNIKHFLYTN